MFGLRAFEFKVVVSGSVQIKEDPRILLLASPYGFPGWVVLAQ